MGNVTINIATQTASWQMDGAITSIQGNFTMINTGATTFRFFANTNGNLTIGGNINVQGGQPIISSGTAASTVTIGGSINVSGGTFNTSTGAGVVTTNVAGNLTVSGGTMTIASSSASVLNLAGGFTQTGGTFQQESTAANTLNFVAGGTGDINVTSGTNLFSTVNVAAGRTVTVLNTSTVTMKASRAFNVNGTLNIAPGAVIGGASGQFVLNSGGTLGIGSPNGIVAGSILSGNVQTTNARTFSTSANYVYNGVADQVTGDALPATVNRLTLANTGASGNNFVTLSRAGTTTLSAATNSLVLTSGLLRLGASTNILAIAPGGGIAATSGNFDNIAPATAGTVAFAGSGTVTGTVNFYPAVTLAGGVNFNNTSTIHNILQINAGGFVDTNSPTYATGSTLVYNPGGNYDRNAEWSNLVSGQGVPHNVTIQNGTTLNFGQNNANSADRYLTGNLQLGSTSTTGSLNMQAMDKKIVVGGSVIIGNMFGGTSTLTLSTANGGDIEVKGNWARSAFGSFVHNNRAVFFTGATSTAIATATQENFGFLFINKNAGVATTINNADIQVQNLTLNSVLTTNSFKVIIPSQTGVTANAGGWVAGYLQKAVSAAGAVNFEIGGPTNYRPVNLNFSTVSTGGTLTAFVSQTAGQYTPLTGSGLVPGKVLTRSYNLAPSGLAGTYNAVFNFINPTDVPAGADPATFVVRNTTNGGTTWTAPGTGTRTSTSTEATGITSFGDFVIGNAGTLIVTTQPADNTKCEGENATFTSAAASSEPSSFPIAVQWEVSTDNGSTWTAISNGTVYSGVTTGTLTITNAPVTLNGYLYRAVFTDASSTATSDPATLTINALPTVSIDGPASQTTCTGTPLTLTTTSTAGGGTIASYQWRRNGTNIGGATSSSYAASITGSYTVILVNSNGCADTSAAVTVTVNANPAKPVITASSATACDPAVIKLYTSYVGGMEWQPGGATTDTLVVTGAGTYTYSVRHTDGNGCVSADADSITVTIYSQHSVTIFPAGGPSALEFCQGGSVDLSSSEPTGNTWTTNSSTPISNPNDNTIEVNTAGTYTLTHTNGNGCTATHQVVVKVNPVVTPTVGITTTPPGAICGATTVTFEADTTGGGNAATFQWFINNVAVNGETNRTFTTSAVNSGDSVKVTFTSTATCATPNPVSATVGISGANTWNGSVSNNWSTPGNWSCGTVPAATDDATIPNVSTLPQLTAASAVKSLTISAGATVDLNNNALTINGVVSGAGTISGTLNSDITINGTGTLNFTSGANTLNDLTVNSTGIVAIGTTVNIAGILTPTAGTLNLGNSNITLLAGTEGQAVYGTRKVYPQTGIVGPVGGTASVTYGTGRFVVERYIPAKRAFRFLAPPVTTTTSIKENWMEGANNPGTSYANNIDPVPGYGTHITGSPTTGNNLDWTVLNNPSLFVHNNIAQTWPAVYNSNGTLTAGEAYRLLVRGDRSYDLSSNTATATATILRTTGILHVGPKTFNASSTPTISQTVGAFSLIGNPYPAPINWTGISKTSLTTTYYTWDPNINVRGSYVNYNSTTGFNSNGSSAVGANIQPGQAFFVETIGAGASLTINESDKTTTFTDVFRDASTMPSLKLQLLLNNNAGTRNVADGAVVVFDNSFSAAVASEDAAKPGNLDENLGIVHASGKTLSIEGRPMAQINDTVRLKTWQYRQNTYLLKVDAANFDPLTRAVVRDNFLNQETPLALAGQTVVPFSITSDAASSATDRFMIVFKQSGALPVTITDLKAYQKDKGVQVDWTSRNEVNIASYDVEKSNNGQSFEKVANVKTRRNNASVESYGWFDNNPVAGNNYYRIKVIERSGETRVTNIVKVNIGKAEAALSVYPNPVKGKTMNLGLINLNKGKYSLVLFNDLGQPVVNRTIEHNRQNATITVNVGSVVSKGTYRLVLTDGETELRHTVIFE
jgi:hypothetical protein